jgi:hypothetical protein
MRSRDRNFFAVPKAPFLLGEVPDRALILVESETSPRIYSNRFVGTQQDTQRKDHTRILKFCVHINDGGHLSVSALRN